MAVSTHQYTELWANTPELDITIRRIGNTFIQCPSRGLECIESILNYTGRLSGPEGETVKALLLERLVDILGMGSSKSEILQVIMKISDWVLKAFSPDKLPVRRMRYVSPSSMSGIFWLTSIRFICRLVGIYSQTGAHGEEVTALLDELDRLGQVKVS